MSDVKRVLVFHPALAPYRIDLFNALSKIYTVRIIFLNKDVQYQSYNQAKLLENLLADYGYLEKKLNIFERQIHYGISAEISSFRPDVIVTHEFSATSFFVTIRKMLGCKVPHVVWTADNPMVIGAENPIRTLMRKIILPKLDGLIVYAGETRAYYQEKCGFKKHIGICPNAQLESRLREKLESELSRTEKLCVKHELIGEKVVLFVGRLARVKRLDLLINAFAAIHIDQPDTVLVLVGDGPDKDNLEECTLSNGVSQKTIFAGHVEGPELYAWFNCGSVFTLTSESETWGAVINEALVAGMPVICSDQAGARVLIEDGFNGEVVNANDPEKLNLALSSWLNRCSPVLPDQYSRLRPMLMSHGFQDAVQGFCFALESAVQSK